VSFQELLQSINDKGFSDYKIGELVGADQSTVFRLRTGKHQNTNYSVGKKIVDLYESLSSQNQSVSN